MSDDPKEQGDSAKKSLSGIEGLQWEKHSLQGIENLGPAEMPPKQGPSQPTVVLVEHPSPEPEKK